MFKIQTEDLVAARRQCQTLRKDRKCFLRARGAGSWDVTLQSAASADRNKHMKSGGEANIHRVLFGAKVTKINSKLHWSSY